MILKQLMILLFVVFFVNASLAKDDPNMDLIIQIAQEEGAIKTLKKQLDQQVAKNGEVVAELPYEIAQIITAGALTVGSGKVLFLGQALRVKSLTRAGWIGIPIFGVTTFLSGLQVTESFIVFYMTKSEALKLIAAIDIRLNELNILKESLEN